jgi:hypothetical protein
MAEKRRHFRWLRVHRLELSVAYFVLPAGHDAGWCAEDRS